MKSLPEIQTLLLSHGWTRIHPEVSYKSGLDEHYFYAKDNRELEVIKYSRWTEISVIVLH